MLLTLSYDFLLNYSWIWTSIVTGFTVFFLFPYGGAAMLFMLGRNDNDRMTILKTVVSKWWIHFVCLGLYFVSFKNAFPGVDDVMSQGFYFRDISILLMILLAISCQILIHSRTISRTLRSILTHLVVVSGWITPMITALAIVSVFTGIGYHMSDAGPVWDVPKSGITMLYDQRTWFFCATWTAVAQTSALLCLYLVSWDTNFRSRIVRYLRIALPIAIVLFIIMSVGLLISPGYDIIDGTATYDSTKYLNDLMHMPVIAVMIILGFFLFFAGIIFVIFNSLRHAVFFYAPGIILVIVSLFMLAGLCHGSFLPSTTHPECSLTIHNASAAPATLRAYFFATIAIIITAITLATIHIVRYHKNQSQGRFLD